MKRICALFIFLSMLFLLPAGAEVTSPADMDYGNFIEWAQARYGYEAPDRDAYLAYDPIYVDPVAYWAYINDDHGVKDGELFIIQRHRTPLMVENYLTHLEKFGYSRGDVVKTDEGMTCTLTLPKPWNATAACPAVIRIEYVNEARMLVVRYDSRYGLVNRIWRNRDLTGAISPLPASASDGKGGTVTLKKVMTAPEADSLYMPLDHWLNGLDFDLWHLWGVFACVSDSYYDASTYTEGCGWRRVSTTTVPLLQLDIDGAAFDPERCFLVMRSPTAGVMLHPLLFWGEKVPGQEMFTVDMSRSSNENLWLIFSPYPYEAGTPMRLYMDLSGSEAGSPLENWAYIDFTMPAQP